MPEFKRFGRRQQLTRLSPAHTRYPASRSAIPSLSPTSTHYSALQNRLHLLRTYLANQSRIKIGILEMTLAPRLTRPRLSRHAAQFLSEGLIYEITPP